MYNTTWPHLFWKIFVDFLTSTVSKIRRRFFQILWPSQKTQTLLKKGFYSEVLLFRKIYTLGMLLNKTCFYLQLYGWLYDDLEDAPWVFGQAFCENKGKFLSLWLCDIEKKKFMYYFDKCWTKHQISKYPALVWLTKILKTWYLKNEKSLFTKIRFWLHCFSYKVWCIGDHCC